MAVPAILRTDADEVEAATGLKIDLIPVPQSTQVYVVLKQVSLPAGAFAVSTSDVLYMTDEQYRYSAMDMFWTELEVLRPDGSIPEGASEIEHHLERRWRRFSWHRNGVWNPNRNGLLDHYEFMQARFAVEVNA